MDLNPAVIHPVTSSWKLLSFGVKFTHRQFISKEETYVVVEILLDLVEEVEDVIDEIDDPIDCLVDAIDNALKGWFIARSEW